MTRRVHIERGRRQGRTALAALGAVYHPPAAAGRPVKVATFAPDPARRSMIAKLHLAKKELGFDDGDYRALLERLTGQTSAKNLTIPQLDKVLGEMKRMGFQAKPAKGPRPADHPAARKARAMLISLGLLGVIRNPSEASLEAFARRQMGVERLQWADQAQVYKLIEALKAIAERHGWDQSTAGLADPIWTLKLRLCEAIIKRLRAAGAIPAEATLGSLAGELLGIGSPVLELTERQLEQLAADLGRMLARHAAADHYED